MVVVQFLRTLKSKWLDLWREPVSAVVITVWHGVGRGHARLGCVFLTYDEARVTCCDIGRLPLVN